MPMFYYLLLICNHKKASLKIESNHSNTLFKKELILYVLKVKVL